MITSYLEITLLLFLISLAGIFLNRKNIIILLMSIELMLLAINYTSIIFSVYIDDIIGQMFSLFILTIAGSESSIGLAILLAYYRIRGTVAISHIHLMKG